MNMHTFTNTLKNEIIQVARARKSAVHGGTI